MPSTGSSPESPDSWGMEGPEGFNDWEQIQSPGSQIPPPTAQSRHWAMTVIKDDFYKDRSVFPPGDHEGLRISSQDTPQPDSLSPSLSPRSQLLHVQGFGGRLRSRFGVLSSGIVKIASSVRCYAVGAGGFRAFGSAAGGAAAALLLLLSLLYLWVRRWHRLREEEKNRLVLLLKEKDQVHLSSLISRLFWNMHASLDIWIRLVQVFVEMPIYITLISI